MMSFQTGVYGQYPQGPPQGAAQSQPYRQQPRRPDVMPSAVKVQLLVTRIVAAVITVVGVFPVLMVLKAMADIPEPVPAPADEFSGMESAADTISGMVIYAGVAGTCVLFGLACLIVLGGLAVEGRYR